MTDLPAAARRAAADPDDPAAVGAVLAAARAVCAARGWDADELAAAAVVAPPPDAVPVPAVLSARRIALYAGYFDPPTRFHRDVAGRLRGSGFAEVVIRPEYPRPDRADAEHAAAVHRAVMTDLAFADAAGVTIDLDDLDDQRFTAHGALERKYAGRGEVWHVVSDEFVSGGAEGTSVVQTRWEDGPALWQQSRFVVFHPPGSPPDAADLPPRHQLLPVGGHLPTADVRAMVFNGGADAADSFVPSAVAEYIRRHGLFTSAVPRGEVRTRFEKPRLKIVCGPQKDAQDRAAAFRRLESADPNLILVVGGDGTMLHAIREHWRLRLPFLGLNAGHLGHLMNEIVSADLTGAEFVLHRMPMLRVDYVTDDGVAGRGLGFNDAWVERDGGQGAWLRVDVDGETRLKKVVCDGLLVATPSGSSAYARAMGGTPVPLSSPVITLAGSNVFHPRFWKPLALPAETVVRMTSTGDPAKRPVRGFLDGLPLGRVSAMEVRVSPVAAVELAFTPAFDLSARLLRSLFPPDDGY